MKTNLPAKQNLDRELISRVALDIGKEMVAYLEVLYPDVYQTMNSGCKLSIRNHIHNDIMNALETTRADEIEARLITRRDFRRKWLAQYRKLGTMRLHERSGK